MISVTDSLGGTTVSKPSGVYWSSASASLELQARRHGLAEAIPRKFHRRPPRWTTSGPSHAPVPIPTFIASTDARSGELTDAVACRDVSGHHLDVGPARLQLAEQLERVIVDH